MSLAGPANESMTGDDWLRRVFDPALRTSNPPFAELRGAVRALSDCGGLSAEAAGQASRRLDEAEGERHILVRKRSERVGPPASHAAPAHGRLEALLTPGRPLGDADGITVVLVLAELWTSRLVLRLEAMQNELTDALDATYDREWKDYQERWRVARKDGREGPDRSPEQPSASRLTGLPLSVSDDLGTRYHALASATGGSDTPWRSEWRVEPGVPASARELTIALEGSDAVPLVLTLPPRT